MQMARKTRPHRQAGFTLVELSVVMVLVGLLFAAVVKGQEMVDVAKAEKLANDIKNTEALIQRYASMKGRMPGDCNVDGIIDANVQTVTRADAGNSTRAGLYDFTAARPTYAAGATVASANEGCAQMTDAVQPLALETIAAAPAPGGNVWLNDLKLAGLVSDNVPNRVFTKQVNEDFMFVGKVTDNDDTVSNTAKAADYNAILVHNVPQWMARQVAVAINGTDAVANRGRLRVLRKATVDGQYETTWDIVAASDPEVAATANAHRNAMVTIVYFFDRIPGTSL